MTLKEGLVKIADVDITALIQELVNFIVNIWKNFLPEDIAAKL